MTAQLVFKPFEEPAEKLSSKVVERLEIIDPPPRSTSCPPPTVNAWNATEIKPDDVRLTPAYYSYYYSHKPLDHRLPKPLIDWSLKINEQHFDEAKFDFLSLAIEKGSVKDDSFDHPTRTAECIDPTLAASGIIRSQTPMSADQALGNSRSTSPSPDERSLDELSNCRKAITDGKLKLDFTRTPSPGYTSRNRYSGSSLNSETSSKKGIETLPPLTQVKRAKSPFSPTASERQALSQPGSAAANAIAVKNAELQAQAHFQAAMKIQAELQAHADRCAQQEGASIRNRIYPEDPAYIQKRIEQLNITPKQNPNDNAQLPLTYAPHPSQLYPSHFQNVNPVMAAVMGYGQQLRTNGVQLKEGSSGDDTPNNEQQIPPSPATTPYYWKNNPLSAQDYDPYLANNSHFHPRGPPPPGSPYWMSRPAVRDPPQIVNGQFANQFTPNSPYLSHQGNTTADINHRATFDVQPPRGPMYSSIPTPRDTRLDITANTSTGDSLNHDSLYSPVSGGSLPHNEGTSTVDRMLETQNGMNQRSFVLSELKLNKCNNTLNIMDVVRQGLVVELAMDQNGSRFIQQRLEKANPEEKTAVFHEILDKMLELCTDVFGNYVIQKFFEYGLEEHKRILAERLYTHVLVLTRQMYGCRVIQKALDAVDEHIQVRLVRELRGNILECVKDQNGNHVIQKCIERVPPQHITFLVSAFINQVTELSKHPYGCRVVQRLLEHCTDEQKIPILQEISTNALDLIRDQYGNYVIQHVLQRGNDDYKTHIIRAVAGNILPLSKHKFASNVVERCFCHGSEAQRDILVEEVIGHGENSPLCGMVRDQYANYVVQKILAVVSERQRYLLIRRIQQIPNLRKVAYGKHIAACVEKLTGKPLWHYQS